VDKAWIRFSDLHHAKWIAGRGADCGSHRRRRVWRRRTPRFSAEALRLRANA